MPDHVENNVSKILQDHHNLRNRVRETPKVLYHYTSTEGFIGIINSKKLWLSDIDFLNDGAEIVAGLEISKQALAQAKFYLHDKVGNLIEKNDRKRLMTFFNSMEDDIYGSRGEKLRQDIRCLALSLCEHSDQELMWFQYARQGTGFSLGLGTSHLTSLEVLWKKPFIVRVNYDEKLEMDWLLGNFHRLIDLAISHSSKDSLKIIAKGFLAIMILTAIGFKERSWKREKEWRIVYLINAREKFECSHDKLMFRTGKSFFIPYLPAIDVEFGKSAQVGSNVVKLNKVILGPAVDKERTKKSVEIFNRIYGNGIEISNSTMRFRPS